MNVRVVAHEAAQQEAAAPVYLGHVSGLLDRLCCRAEARDKVVDVVAIDDVLRCGFVIFAVFVGVCVLYELRCTRRARSAEGHGHHDESLQRFLRIAASPQEPLGILIRVPYADLVEHLLDVSKHRHRSDAECV